MFATGLGVIPVVLLRRHVEYWRPLLIGVAIGAMSVASIIGLIKPGLRLGSTAEVVGGALLGAAMFFAVRRALSRHEVSVAGLSGRGMRAAIVTFSVLFVHSLPEGFAIGTAFAAPDHDIGLFVICAIALQNIPEGTSIAIPLQDAGVSSWRQFWIATATSIPQPIGALIAYVLVDEISGLLPISFGFAAGAMLVLVAIEMVPEGFVQGSIERALVGTAFGAALIFALEAAIGV